MNDLELELKSIHLRKKTLEAISTKGGNLANYSLGTSGNIVVSGKTYKWDQCNVSGTCAN
jgi:hypothetical protein